MGYPLYKYIVVVNDRLQEHEFAPAETTTIAEIFSAIAELFDPEDDHVVDSILIHVQRLPT
jgi:hypothetical protein